MQRDLLFLSEAVHAAEKVVNLCEGATAESLQADERTLDAVLWNFTVLGEACNQFGQKEHFPAISWAKPIAMRNRVVHGYWSADLQILLDTVQDDLPILITQLSLDPPMGWVSDRRVNARMPLRSGKIGLA